MLQRTSSWARNIVNSISVQSHLCAMRHIMHVPLINLPSWCILSESTTSKNLHFSGQTLDYFILSVHSSLTAGSSLNVTYMLWWWCLLSGQEYPPYEPRWFRKEMDEQTGNPIHIFTHEYWKCKEKQDWDRCPDIYLWFPHRQAFLFGWPSQEHLTLPAHYCGYQIRQLSLTLSSLFLCLIKKPQQQIMIEGC